MLIKNSNEQKIKNNKNGKKNVINFFIQIPNISNTNETVVVILAILQFIVLDLHASHIKTSPIFKIVSQAV